MEGKCAKRATDHDVYVATRLRLFRQQRGLSQSDLAKKLGLTFQQIQKYEKGTNRIGAGRLFEIAEILKVPIEVLYPEKCKSDADATVTRDGKELSDFILSIEGWKLCSAYVRIRDAHTRKMILALVNDVADSSSD
jgi:transcriptional regulator with XRE-family HTH domain